MIKALSPAEAALKWLKGIEDRLDGEIGLPDIP